MVKTREGRRDANIRRLGLNRSGFETLEKDKAKTVQ